MNSGILLEDKNISVIFGIVKSLVDHFAKEIISTYFHLVFVLKLIVYLIPKKKKLVTNEQDVFVEMMRKVSICRDVCMLYV